MLLFQRAHWKAGHKEECTPHQTPQQAEASKGQALLESAVLKPEQVCVCEALQSNHWVVTGQLALQLLCCNKSKQPSCPLRSGAAPEHVHAVHLKCFTALIDTHTSNPVHTSQTRGHTHTHQLGFETLRTCPTFHCCVLLCRSSSATLQCRPCCHATGGSPASKPGLRSCLLMTWRCLCSTKTRPTGSGTASAAGRATGIVCVLFEVHGRGGVARRQHHG